MIRDDYSYIGGFALEAIRKGFAHTGVHSIRLERIPFTDEEMAENVRRSHIMNTQQWNSSCEQRRQATSNMIHQFLVDMSREFILYQFDESEQINDYPYSSDKWELFFWCGDANGRNDYSYARLSPNDKRNDNEIASDISRCVEFISKHNSADRICATVQYKVLWHDDSIKQTVRKELSNMTDGFITFHEQQGRIKVLDDGKLAFMKKGAKKKGIYITERDLLHLVI